MPFHFTISKASMQDTLRYILNFINKYSTDPFVIQLAKEFNPAGDKQEFIKRVFDYICENGYYQLDKEGEEEVWTPAKTISARNAAGKFQYDCKKITILLGSVLKAAGIEPVLKHVMYSDGKGGFEDFTHIYIIVPYPDLEHYLVVDPTNNCMWNTEVDHAKGNLYFLNGQTQSAPMNLHLIGNNNKSSSSLLQMFGESAGQVEDTMCEIVGCPHPTMDAQSVGGSNTYFSFTTAENLAHIAKVVAYAPVRAAFLGLLYLGKLLANTPVKLNLASHIAYAWNANPSAFRKFWWLQGGEADASVIQTALKKIVGGVIYGPPSKDRPWIIRDALIHGMNGTVGQGPETLAAIATATPILVAVLAYLKKNNIIKDGQVDPTAPPGTVPIIPDNGVPANTTPVSSGSILDLSSPLNTIVKSIFLMGISAMIAGPHFYILNTFCGAAIIYSLVKHFRQ